ncbi:E2 domain-containing protein [Brevundimonas naejangsanensis]|uniref:E2 domain-containing protein n=1 Tax=Brevundimonas naejangsanensis TaxID=588932 RepID=UPI0032E41C15
MSRELDLLTSGCPAWFEIEERASLGLVGRARAGLWVEAGVRLRVIDGRPPRVREAAVGTVFPAACSERHIEEGGLFCTGLHTTPIRTSRDAARWWGKLEQYLLCQAAAESTRVWPLAHGLDHGAAGEPHRRALRLAEKLGVEEDYLKAYLGEPSWFTSTGLDLLGDKRTAGRSKQPRLRRPKVCRCKDRIRLLEIVMLERVRRRELGKFWDSMRRSKRPCCGTMRSCPLAKSPPIADLERNAA